MKRSVAVVVCSSLLSQAAIAQQQSLGDLVQNSAEDASWIGAALVIFAGILGVIFLFAGLVKIVAIVRNKSNDGWGVPITSLAVGTVLIALVAFAEAGSQTIWKQDQTSVLNKLHMRGN